MVGTLDIEQAIQKGERHFEPGVLASANRGLLYIDEVNLLDDHVVDVLLDSAAMGVNMVEREGISFTHPSRFILVGTMNPEEGELRPQLLDRFALSVDIVGIRDARERVMIMERNLGFEQDAEAFRSKWMPKEEELSHQIERARELVGQVTHTSRDLLSIAALTASLNVDGHRADLVILSANPLTVDDATIKDIKVLQTIKDGKMIYDAADKTRALVAECAARGGRIK